MKAICVTPERALAVRDVPEPSSVPPGHILVRIEAAGINHGDKTFLRNPAAASAALANVQHDIWGASAAGRVVALGDDVPSRYAGKQVAIYRSLSRTPHTLGLWSAFAVVSATSCLILPDDAQARDYSGSLVNIITAWAYLAQVADAGHFGGVVVTAGQSLTGQAIACLAKARDVPIIPIVRSEASRDRLQAAGHRNVIVMSPEGGAAQFDALQTASGPLAVFDGVGGRTLSHLAPHLPFGSVIDIYGFLDFHTPLTLPTVTIMGRDLTIRRFSNFESATVKDKSRLATALQDLEPLAGQPMLRTPIGKIFSFDEIDAAMAFETTPGRKAVLVPS